MSTIGPGQFGRLLQQYRTAAELSQEELAERAGLSRRGISDLERGVRRAPHPATVRRLAEAMHLDPAQRATLVRGALTRASSELPETTPEQTERDKRSNLPAQVTSLIGRTLQVDEVRELLATRRLLTVTGPGGIGKTRLAFEVARGVLPKYPDGVWLVELAPLADPDFVAHRVGAVVNVRESADQPVLRALASSLRTKRLLLVLDNCEHLLQPCAVLVDSLLRSCPDLRILVTSREPLGILGELVWRVPPLPVPEVQQSSTVAQLEHNPALQLFIERARAVQPRFALTIGNAPAVAQICRRLDGVPLALELAAARVDSLTVEQLAIRLDQRFSLLTGGSRVASARQQTLAATLDWSYDLLSTPERRMIERLTVFAGGWTLEAAEAICPGEAFTTAEVLDLLARLIRKSLVTAEATVDGVERYTFLETVREYARQKLSLRSAESAALRGRHAQYYAALADGLKPPDLIWNVSWSDNRGASETPGQLLDRLYADRDNLTAALSWLRDSNQAVEGLTLAYALGGFWTRAGLYAEGRYWWMALLDLADRTPGADDAGQRANTDGAHDAVMTRLRAGALYGLAFFANQQGDYQQALTHSAASAALYRDLKDPVSVASALGIQGLSLWLVGRTPEAGAVLEESRRVLDESAERGEAARDCAAQILRYLGLVARSQRQYQRAVVLFRESVAQSMWGYARARGTAGLGRAVYLQGDVRQAALILCQALAVIRADRLGGHSLGNCLDYLAAVAAALGESRRAAVLFGAAQAQWQTSGAARYEPDRAAYEHEVADVQAQLGSDEFAAAWARGHAMTAEEAISSGLEQVTPNELAR